MNILERPSVIVSLEGLERHLSWKPPLRMIGWFREHLYWHRGAPVEGDNISFVFAEEPGAKVDLDPESGIETDSTALGAPRLGCVRHGARIVTLATVRRDELIFQYPPGTLPPGEFPFAGGVFTATPAVLRLQRDILETLDRLAEPGTADRLDLLTLQLLAEVRSAMARESSPERVDPRIYRIAAKLATECGRPGTVEELAGEYGFSRSAFYRAWRAYSGRPPGEVLRENRLRLAARLAASTRLTLKEIAHRSGFRDGVGLSQAFRAYYGMSPREFARGAAAGGRAALR